MTEFKDGIRSAAELMAISARTAPKAKGEDYIEIRILYGEEMEGLGRALLEYSEKSDDPMWARDGNCILRSDAVLLIGTRDPLEGKAPSGSGAKVKGDIFAEGDRAKRLIDLGIALGSAAKTASILNVDNRIMWRTGEMARRTGLMKAYIVIGIPISATGKNIYFDR